jgi:hypothetical protein
MLAAASVAALSFAPAGLHAPAAVRVTSPVMEATGMAPDLSDKPWTSSEISDKAGLAALAKELNPVVGYWDPLGIGELSPETIGWFRAAEIKHGRVAMFGFVGYTVQANGIHWPGNIQQPFPFNPDVTAISYADISAAGGPADQWDALPDGAKIQIFGFIAGLELWSEASTLLEKEGTQHYVRGGKPGVFPAFKGNIPHPVPFNLFDPFGFSKKRTEEQKAKGRLAEINNGRLAMIGMMGYVSAAKGLYVPGLDTLPIPKYSGEIMAPFSSTNAALPFVKDMLTWTGPYY